jgi:hypothetical protein
VAQPVVDGLVGQQRVVDVGARAQPGLQRRGHRLGRGPPDLAIGREQPAQSGVERKLLAVDVDLERRHELLEQAPPGGLAGQRLLGEDLLLGLGEQVGAVAPGRAQVVAREVEPLGRQQLLRAGVVECRPLELEEQELGLELGGPLLHLLQERSAGGVGGVGGELQGGVGAGASELVLDRGELLHGADQARPVELGDLAGMGAREGVRAAGGLVEQPVDPGGPVTVDQLGEVPADALELGIADGGHARRVRSGP